MEIRYLKELANNPQISGRMNSGNMVLEPISMDEIIELEHIFNNGNMFPVAIRELLFLAGRYCYVLDYGLNDSQLAMQNQVRAWMKDYDRNYEIARPFFAIDTYGSGEQFIFVYTDSNDEDPILYQAYLEEDPDIPFIYSLDTTLSKYIERGIDELKRGGNPY